MPNDDTDAVEVEMVMYGDGDDEVVVSVFDKPNTNTEFFTRLPCPLARNPEGCVLNICTVKRAKLERDARGYIISVDIGAAANEDVPADQVIVIGAQLTDCSDHCAGNRALGGVSAIGQVERFVMRAHLRPIARAHLPDIARMLQDGVRAACVDAPLTATRDKEPS